MLACAHGRSAEQKALLERADCAELLRAADAARAAGDPDLAADLAAACPQDRLSALLDRSPPAEALLWCGRARAALLKPACEAGRVSALAAKFEPAVPAPEELKKRAALAWLRNLAKALAASPPENVDLSDVKGCVAYGFSLNLAAGDPGAAAAGLGEPAKVAACEKLLGEPAGAGIPVP